MAMPLREGRTGGRGVTGHLESFEQALRGGRAERLVVELVFEEDRDAVLHLFLAEPASLGVMPAGSGVETGGLGDEKVRLSLMVSDGPSSDRLSALIHYDVKSYPLSRVALRAEAGGIVAAYSAEAEKHAAAVEPGIWLISLGFGRYEIGFVADRVRRSSLELGDELLSPRVPGSGARPGVVVQPMGSGFEAKKN